MSSLETAAESQGSQEMVYVSCAGLARIACAADDDDSKRYALVANARQLREGNKLVFGAFGGAYWVYIEGVLELQELGATNFKTEPDRYELRFDAPATAIGGVRILRAAF